MSVIRSAAISLVVLVAPLVAQQRDVAGWPEYRGPTADGHAPASARVPREWSEKKNVRWKTPIEGRGWSSPVVRGGRVWLTSATEKGRRMFVVAVDLDSGEPVLERTLVENEMPEPRNKLNSYASPSPVIGEDRVWVHFGTYGTFCLDAETGDTLWERLDINCDHMEGPGSSPVLVGDLLIFNVDGGDVQYVTALDAQSGETRWSTPRSSELQKLVPDLRKAYSTPIVIEVGGAPWLISSGSRATVAYDPQSGRELWKVGHIGFSMSSRPLYHDGLLFLNTGYMRPELLAARVDGDDTEGEVEWSFRRNIPTMASALLVDGRIFMVDNGGIASCLEAATGKRLWRQRIGGEHSASPVFANGCIYFFDREGRTVVIEPGDKFKAIETNRLDEGFMASPAIADDAFVLRTETHLYRIEEERAR